MLSPKQDLMVVYLDNRMQRMEWQKIYKKMQFNYHVGLLLGVIAAILFTMSIGDKDKMNINEY
jgi:heterodisulfide reductase subunit A-like polyferredoxin